MEENYTERCLENLLNSSKSIVSRFDLSLKLGAISLLLDFQNIEKHIEEKIAKIESLSPFDKIYDVNLLYYADEFEKISFNKTHVIEANIDEDADVTNIKFKKTTKEILAKSFQEY